VQEPAVSYSRKPRIPEDHIISIWLSEAIPGRSFLTTVGKRITIVSVGKRNRFEGPDFLAARILDDGMLYEGSIEIHRNPSDWFAHHHQTDARYHGVLVHVVLYDSPKSATIPARYTVCLSENLTKTLATTWIAILPETTEGSCNPCTSHAPLLPRSIVSAMITIAASERFTQKMNRVRTRYEELSFSGTGVKQLFYEMLARALGFGGNQDAMESLARRLPLHTLEESTGRQAANILSHILHFTDKEGQTLPPSNGNDFLPAAQVASGWKRKSVRAVNRIISRLPALALFAARLLSTNWLEDLKREIRSGKKGWEHVDNLLVLPQHSPGKERRKEILTNVLAPFFSLCGEMTDDNELQLAATALYFTQQDAPQNRITRSLRMVIGVPDTLSSGEQQGLLQLHQIYCSNRLCHACLIGQQSLVT